MAAIELDRRRTEQVPRLSARLESWTTQGGFGLSVAGVFRAALQDQSRSPGGLQPGLPARATRGQNGVGHELPPSLEAEGNPPAWRNDTLRPLADWTERMAPGTPEL